MKFSRICIVGLGYIGLPTAAMFASCKVKVIGVDVSQQVVDTINQGKIHIVEPELDTLVSKTVSEKYLTAVTKCEFADVFIIAVPTPFKGNNHEPDLSFIESACKSIAPVLKKGNLVILESTSPVGATEQMAEWLNELRTDLAFPQTHGENSDIRIAHCPERVLPGRVIKELVDNDRVIGGMTPRCSVLAKSLYQLFVKGQCVVTNARTAEMAKLTENSFRDVNIAFANELSIICDELEINVWELIELANRHPRVNILQPGPGVGGHCIAVDPWFIVSKSPDKARLIQTAREVNDSKPHWVVEKVKSAITDYLLANPCKTVKEVTLACYGLAFKPDIDDLRESPSVEIAQHLIELHIGSVLLVEPNIDELPLQLASQQLVTTEQALRQADIHIVLVDHKNFKQYKPEQGIVVDVKGIWE